MKKHLYRMFFVFFVIGTLLSRSSYKVCNSSRTICKTVYVLTIDTSSGVRDCSVSRIVYGQARGKEGSTITVRNCGRVPKS